MKLITLLTVVLYFCFCSPQSSDSKLKISRKDSVQLQKGILLLSSLRMDYFFPVDNDSEISRLTYKNSTYTSGFLLFNLGSEPRSELLKNYSDTLLLKGNYPFTHVIPVEIEYKMTNEIMGEGMDTDTVCFALKTERICLGYDKKVRLIHKITAID